MILCSCFYFQKIAFFWPLDYKSNLSGETTVFLLLSFHKLKERLFRYKSKYRSHVCVLNCRICPSVLFLWYKQVTGNIVNVWQVCYLHHFVSLQREWKCTVSCNFHWFIDHIFSVCYIMSFTLLDSISFCKISYTYNGPVRAVILPLMKSGCIMYNVSILSSALL